LVFAGAILMNAAPAFAQTPNRLALADLVAEAVAKNPEIAAAERRYEAMKVRPVQERSLPDPMVSAGYNSSGSPRPGAGIGRDPNANAGVMVSQMLPYPGKLALRSAIAEREADAEFQQIAAARVNVTARVKQAYFRLAYTYAVSDVLQRNKQLLDTLLKVSEGRYAVGHAAQQDVIKAQTQLSVLELQTERVAQERAIREGELNALLNRASTAPLGVPEDLQLVAFDVALDALVAMANEHAPMLQRDAILIDRARLAIDAARKDYKPDFAVSGGYAYMGSMPPMYEFRFDVTLPLQRARRAAAVVEQQHTSNEARSSLESTRLRIQSRVQEDYRMASTSVRLARMYRDGVLPQARLALESSLASYQSGTVDFLSVLTNFGTVLEYEMTYYDELASFHTAVSRLEETIGAPLPH
jgi:outer membrane protein TolC